MADKLLKYDVAMKSTKTVWQMETPICYTGDENTVTFDFNIIDLEEADLVGVIPNVYLYMRDGSFFQNGPADGVEITGTTVNYTMKGNEGKHSGIAKAQLVLVWDDEVNPPEKLTSQMYAFEVVSGLENKVAVEVMIQDWTTLTREARTFIDTSADEVDALKGELQTAITTANTSLGEFDVALQNGIVATNIAAELQNLEETYAPDLFTVKKQLEQTEQNLSSQLAQRALQTDLESANSTITELQTIKMDKSTTDISVSQINKNKGLLDETYFTDTVKQQWAGTTPVNATPPNGGVTSAKLAESAVEWQKTAFIKIGKNLFNYDTRLISYGFDASGGVVAKTDYDLSDFIPVVAGQEYTLNRSRIIYFYDVTKTIIYTSKVDNSSMAVITTTAPVDAFYMRVQVYKTYSHIMQVEKGTVESSYEPYKLEIEKINIKKENLENNSVGNQHLVDKSFTPAKADFITLGKNLFNPGKATDSYYLQETSGNLIANASFVTSDFIPVKSGTTYTINSARKFVVYDLNKVYVSGLNQTQGVYTFTANADGYVRFSYSKDLVTDVQMEIGSATTSFEQYGFEIPNLIVDQSNVKTDVLNGKYLYAFGESIMKGAGNNNIGLRDLIAQKYNMSGANYAVSGASLAYYADRSHIVAQIQNAITAGITPDIIIMNGGINDVTFNVLGDIATDYNYETNGFATFSSGLEYCFGLLKTTFPNVPLIYIWVHHMPSRNQDHQKAHHDRAVEICEKWSVPVVDMYRDGGMNTMLTSHMENFTYYPTETSGTHPNADGYNSFYVPATVSEIRKRIS